jgi:hypothetical protein
MKLRRPCGDTYSRNATWSRRHRQRPLLRPCRIRPHRHCCANSDEFAPSHSPPTPRTTSRYANRRRQVSGHEGLSATAQPTQQPLWVRCGGAGHVRRPCALPSIAGIPLHRHEPPHRARSRLSRCKSLGAIGSSPAVLRCPEGPNAPRRAEHGIDRGRDRPGHGSGFHPCPVSRDL